MKLNTVNVIEYFNNTIQQIASFEDNESGNKLAEHLFKQIANENSFNNDEIEIGLDNGYVGSKYFDYQLFLTHSS